MINRVLLFFLLFSGIQAFAQLSVRNDAYLFVTDEVIFVNDDVNLIHTDSKVYLRNEAQLIQGTGTTGNSGIGELSVYQSGNTNQWAYNYWCLPVGNNSASSGNENGRINLIDEATNIVTAADPTGLTSSIDVSFTTSYDSSLSPLTISNQWFYTYINGSLYIDWVAIGGASNITPGLGYTMKGVGTSLTPGASSQIYDFRGKPNNGTISNSISTGNFTLIGNPYPSAIDAADFLWDAQNTNLDEVDPYVSATTGALYYWEQAPNSNSHFIEDYVGGYASYTCTQPDGMDNVVESFVPAPYLWHLSDGTVVTPPGVVPTGSHVARRYIPIGQGFMVEGAANGLVYVKNSHRAYVKESSGNSEFFRTAETGEDDIEPLYDTDGRFIVPDGYKRFRIITSFNDLYSRELLANFHHSATDGFDYGMEAKSFNVIASDAHWTLNEEPYIIQAHNYSIDLRIPLVVTVEQQQPVKFGLFDIQNFDSEQPIYLYDAEADLYIDLTEQNYNINLAAGDYPNRFEITFQADTLTTEEIIDEDFDVFQNNKNSELIITNPNGLMITSVSLFDVAGKSVINTEQVGNQNHYSYSTKSFSEGVYIATINIANYTSITKKVIIKND